jgi:hypothetical protein
MLPLSTTRTGTDVPSASCKPKKNPKTTVMIIPIRIADLKYSFRRIFEIMLTVLPSQLALMKMKAPLINCILFWDRKQKIVHLKAFFVEYV